MVVTLSISLIVIVPVSLFTLVAVKQGVQFTESLSKDDGISFDSIAKKISELQFIEPLFDNPEEVKTKLKEYISTGSTGAAEYVLNIVGNLPNLILHLFLAIVACFFFLMDGKSFIAFLDNKIPLDPDVRAKIQKAFKNTAISVIWATLAAAAAQAVCVFFTFLFLGIPGAFLAGGATFILSWIPLIGFTPVLVAGCIYLYAQGSMGLLLTLLIIGFFIGLLDNYIRPYVLKGRDKTHPFVSLIAIFGGISMFGIMGVFVGPVFAATLIALLQIWPTVGQRFGLSFEDSTIDVPKQHKLQ